MLEHLRQERCAAIPILAHPWRLDDCAADRTLAGALEPFADAVVAKYMLAKQLSRVLHAFLRTGSRHLLAPSNLSSGIECHYKPQHKLQTAHCMTIMCFILTYGALYGFRLCRGGRWTFAGNILAEYRRSKPGN